MPQITIAIGTLLMLQGAGFYLASNTGSWTPAIPAIPGVVCFVLGYLALLAPGARKHLMHVVMLIALLGAMMALMRGLPALGADPASQEAVDALVARGMLDHVAAKAELTSVHWAKVWDQLLMAFFCLVLVALGVGSFVKARRATA